MLIPMPSTSGSSSPNASQERGSSAKPYISLLPTSSKFAYSPSLGGAGGNGVGGVAAALVKPRIAVPFLVLAASLYFLVQSSGSLLGSMPGRPSFVARPRPATTAPWTTWVSPTPALPIEATLEDRLRDWEAAPLGEPADWVAHSIQACPGWRIKPRQNKLQLENSHLLWSSLNSTAIASLRGELISYLRKAQNEGKLSPSMYGSGRGLAFSAGNADTFSRVLMTLKMLHKHLDSPLESEIFSFPGEKPDEETRKELEAMGATLRIVDGERKDKRRAKNYHLKSTAIVASRFREVLYLDSDNIPTGSLLGPSDYDADDPRAHPSSADRKWADPSGLFESKAYKRLGIMLWPDYWRTSADNPIWAITGTQCRDEWETEAGTILVDKSRHLDIMLLAQYWMGDGRWRFWYNLSDGDKDLFRYAALALRKRWAVPGRFVGVGGAPGNFLSGYGGHTMLQMDHTGRPLFVHANLLKQIPSGVGRGFAWGRTRQVLMFSNGVTLDDSNAHLPTFDASRFVDYDVDSDHIANVDSSTGYGIRKDGPPSVRRRAVAEKGLVNYWHGGSISALAIDVRYEDPRTSGEKRTAALASWAATKGGLENVDKPQGDDAVPDDTDISLTVTDDGVELPWVDPIETVQWADDVRLKDFEQVFFDEGGKINGEGF